MKIGKIAIAAALALVLTLTSTLACSLAGSQSQAAQQVTIAKGDLTVTVNGNGKACYATDANLTFGSAGKVDRLAVIEGEVVTKGTVIAQLETDQLELALSQAQVAEAQAQLALTQALTAQTQTEMALTTARFNLDRLEEVSDLKDDIVEAEEDVRIAQMRAQEAAAVGDSETARYWRGKIPGYEAKLQQSQKKLAELLTEAEYLGVAPYIDTTKVTIIDGKPVYEISGTRYERLILEDIHIKQLQVKQAEQEIEQAALRVEQAKRSLEQAQKAVKVAQKNLDDATISAPFDGAVAELDIKKGDIVGTSASDTRVPVYMVDSNSLEISAEIDEIDIAGVQPGQKAIISLDSLPESKYEGKVTAISMVPVNKPQNQGVVVYEVKIGFNGPAPAGIKSGMSATVDIITQEKKEILLVPNKSIKRNNRGETVVSVLVDQQVEERVVTLGITDGVQTEVISGLNAGDLVIRPDKETNLKLT